MATSLGTRLLRSGARPEQGLHQSPSDRSLLAYLSFAGRKVAFQEMQSPPTLKDPDKLIDLDAGVIEYLAFNSSDTTPPIKQHEVANAEGLSLYTITDFMAHFMSTRAPGPTCGIRLADHRPKLLGWDEILQAFATASILGGSTGTGLRGGRAGRPRRKRLRIDGHRKGPTPARFPPPGCHRSALVRAVFGRPEERRFSHCKRARPRKREDTKKREVHGSPISLTP